MPLINPKVEGRRLMESRPLLKTERARFHEALLSSEVLCLDKIGHGKRGFPDHGPSNSDKDNPTSVSLAQSVYDQICSSTATTGRLAAQRSGSKFEAITRDFLEATFPALASLRPGNWSFPIGHKLISEYEQYGHLSELQRIAATNAELAVALGNEYLIKPDVLVVRHPEPETSINASRSIADPSVATRSPIRQANNSTPLLHASISCKWTLRSDRAQNARSEALNLIRNRKGRVPHIVVVTGEPLPSRLASISLGTGDIDCVYHFALDELLVAVRNLGQDEPISMLTMMVEGKRLKDIADLPLDLAV